MKLLACERREQLTVEARALWDQVLSVENQHELAVLARKFGNLHVYGCWWFCNTPSIIRAYVLGSIIASTI